MEVSSQIAAIVWVVIASALIAVGRYLVRSARRKATRKFRRRLIGWGLMLLGLLVMIIGVLSW